MTVNPMLLQEHHSLTKQATCRYCYQTEEWEHECDSVRTNCSVTAPPPKHLVRTVCRVKHHVFCKGRRAFYKRIRYCRRQRNQSGRKYTYHSVI